MSALSQILNLSIELSKEYFCFRSTFLTMEAKQPERLLYRIKAAAQKLDISVSQAYNLINRGELEAVRVGNALRIPARALEKIVAGGGGQSA
jgi:excisionase family DNA binding protein